MGQRLIIKNFGPIKDIDIFVDDFMLFIGQQACGKSTVAKSIFFFKSLRDDLLKYILSEMNKSERSFVKAIESYEKKIRQKFLDYWGPAFHLEDIYIKYFYTDEIWIELSLEKNNKFVSPVFSERFKDRFDKLINKVKLKGNKFLQDRTTYSTSKDLIQLENEKDIFLKDVETTIHKLFNENKDLLFIPAGRSLLSTLSEQIQNLDTKQLDYLMRTFVERIMNVKRIFNLGIDDLILEKKKLTQDYINKNSIEMAKGLIGNILKGKYVNDKDGEKLFLDSGKYTKLNFSSSGQQESIWILHLLFLLILENQKSFVVIEEPEAHLFPVAQNDMARLVVLLNNLGNNMVITAHSPYILSNFNNLIYAHDVGRKHAEKVNSILPKQFWLDSKKCSMYFIEKGKLVDIIEHDINVVKTEMIDDASELNNKLYSSLFEID